MSSGQLDVLNAGRDAVNKNNSGSFEGLYRNHLYDSSISGGLQNSDNCCLETKLPLFYI